MDLFKETIEGAGLVVDAAGVAVIVIGILVATIRALRRTSTPDERYRHYRQDVGRAILLGLELLVAGDIIRTVAVAPTLQSVSVLGIIVLIRTFLSVSLQVELEGRWPWQVARRRPDAARSTS